LHQFIQTTLWCKPKIHIYFVYEVQKHWIFSRSIVNTTLQILKIYSNHQDFILIHPWKWWCLFIGNLILIYACKFVHMFMYGSLPFEIIGNFNRHGDEHCDWNNNIELFTITHYFLETNFIWKKIWLGQGKATNIHIQLYIFHAKILVRYKGYLSMLLIV
jgi:hypothetical protein